MPMRARQVMKASREAQVENAWEGQGPEQNGGLEPGSEGLTWLRRWSTGLVLV